MIFFLQHFRESKRRDLCNSSLSQALTPHTLQETVQRPPSELSGVGICLPVALIM